LVTYISPVDDAGDAVFRALADPTRRMLLDALFERDGRTVNELCELVPDMTRFGVMKHLAVLEAANLIVSRRDGRTKVHFHNPVPIQQIADRWISKYARPFSQAMTDLQRRLEQQPEQQSEQQSEQQPLLRLQQQRRETS
jgi:DNA-binding transcriptional ArsR family regulator